MKEFKDIKSAEEINQLLTEKAWSHTEYYHYSDIEAIKGILSGKKIWISSMCFSNDTTEHGRFGDETYRYFQLCFSTGTTENLPLWFLYSGKNGRGMRISFPKKVISKLCSDASVELVLVNLKTEDRTKLVPEKNCMIYFRDVLYRKAERDKYRLKYNTRVNNNFPAEEMDKVNEKNRGFIKDIIWFYEKETRLLVEVNDEAIDKRLFQNERESPYRVELTIPDECYKNIGITFSPVYGEKDTGEINKILSDNALMNFNRTKLLSEFAGMVQIDLCKHCCKRKNESDDK